MSASDRGSLYAVSDLHVGYPENRAIAADLHPTGPLDWLIVAGDVAERFGDIVDVLGMLAGRFAKVIWVPGNHELWTHPSDPVTERGQHRYLKLVAACRRLGVVTPEDPFPRWIDGDGVPVVIAPLFTLYDYSFRTPGVKDKETSLRLAYAAGVVCTDEHFLHAEPLDAIDDWCRQRVEISRQRLDELPVDVSTILVSHWPLVREPTDILRYPEFAQWCGTTATADWHLRYRAIAAVYGHLHIPRVTWYDGVRFEEVSLGYPREWHHQDPARARLRRILPEPALVR
ncbi:3',5'-cyclic AMP phosphodiesterase CpdA [Nakamurella sp. UYEF19]|uniref:metallophosphoesterase family protein n=1 Tax=Nakamurella sp. UYEF19 TaxID=1756392 RepID=UPI0033994507